MGDNKESKGRKRRKLLLGISKMTDKDIYTGDSDNIDNKVNKINKENKSPTDKYSDIHKDNGSAGINESEDVFDFVISAPKAQTDKTASEYRGVRRINRASKTYKSRERINNKRPGLYNITQDKVSQDRISSDRISSDKISSDKTSPDKTGSYKTSSYRKNSDKPNLYKSNSDKIDLYKTGSEKTNTNGTDDLRKKGIYSRKKRKRKKVTEIRESNHRSVYNNRSADNSSLVDTDKALKNNKNTEDYNTKNLHNLFKSDFKKHETKQQDIKEYIGSGNDFTSVDIYEDDSAFNNNDIPEFGKDTEIKRDYTNEDSSDLSSADDGISEKESESDIDDDFILKPYEVSDFRIDSDIKNNENNTEYNIDIPYFEIPDDTDTGTNSDADLFHADNTDFSTEFDHDYKSVPDYSFEAMSDLDPDLKSNIESDKHVVEADEDNTYNDVENDIYNDATNNIDNIVYDDENHDNSQYDIDVYINPEERRSRLRPVFKNKKRVMTALGIILGVFLIAYIVRAQTFNTRFFPNTYINGINASFKTPDEVKELIRQEIEVYRLEIKSRENEATIVSGKELGVKFNFDSSLNEMLKKQNPMSWALHYINSDEYDVDRVVDLDTNKFTDTVYGLSFMDEASFKESEDAKISEYKSGSGYSIIPEYYGTALDKSKALNAISSSVKRLDTELDLNEVEGIYTDPVVKKDDEVLMSRAEVMNKYTKTVINYPRGVALNGDTISGWLGVNENGVVVINSDAVNDYVKQLAGELDTVGKPKKVITSYGKTINVNSKGYGWKINQPAEAQAIKEYVIRGQDISREPVYSSRAASLGETDYGNTYVEINLSAQHLHYYKDGQLILESDLVSGNLAKGHRTPPGIFSISYKQRNAILRGPGYAAPVSYWMPFNGGIGLHDAKWRGSFGGNIYKTSGSHGCINLPAGIAKQMFENIDKGCPVICYYMDGSEVDTVTAQAQEEKKNENKEALKKNEEAAKATQEENSKQTEKDSQAAKAEKAKQNTTQKESQKKGKTKASQTAPAQSGSDEKTGESTQEKASSKEQKSNLKESKKESKQPAEKSGSSQTKASENKETKGTKENPKAVLESPGKGSAPTLATGQSGNP